jgi:Ca2+-binding EF-hand superfamily protein
VLLLRASALVREKVRQKCRSSEPEDVKLRQTFKFFDTDESGAVTIDEFGRAMERLGIPLQRRETSLFFAKFDPSGDGRITYEEFVSHVYGDGV